MIYLLNVGVVKTITTANIYISFTTVVVPVVVPGAHAVEALVLAEHWEHGTEVGEEVRGDLHVLLQHDRLPSSRLKGPRTVPRNWWNDQRTR